MSEQMEKLRELVRAGVPFENAYAQCWNEQLDIDKQNNKKLNAATPNYKQAQENARKGGRPKMTAPAPKPRKLSDKAQIINRMLLKGMTLRDIGDVLGVSHQSVMQVKQRYDLPRRGES